MGLNNLLVLGDSTSMSIGCYEHTFPFILSKKKIWNKNSSVYNASLHGFGSADALKFLKKNNFKKLDYIILNIGICDSISSEVLKKKYSPLRKLNYKNSNINKINYYGWNSLYDKSIDKVEDIEHFKFNIQNILKFAINKKIKIIILIPSSNKYFQPGLAKGNFSYYSYLNLIDHSSSKLQFDDPNLKLAFQYAEKKNFKKSNDIYVQILKNNSISSLNSELAYIISNNFAVNDAYLGNHQKSIDLLNILLNEENIRKEIILL